MRVRFEASCCDFFYDAPEVRRSLRSAIHGSGPRDQSTYHEFG
jgi:hypothetical protein